MTKSSFEGVHEELKGVHTELNQITTWIDDRFKYMEATWQPKGYVFQGSTSKERTYHRAKETFDEKGP